MQDYIAKINNTVWTCCVLHNMLLAFDGLDKLWTSEDYLSCWYMNADAERHPEYDRFTCEHDALITARAEAKRLRNFSARALGKKRPSGNPVIRTTGRSLVPEINHDEEGAQPILFNANADLDPVEWQEGFTEKRDALIEHFNIHWNAKKVLWLPFPGTGRR